MKFLAIAVAAALLTGGVGLAQAQQANSTAQQAGNAAQHASDATKINGNQAVATTSANSSMPAKGSNSFTMAEAKSRLEKNGFANVGNLAKDNDGVWRGQAEKGGNMTTVWLDYKGNTGEGK
jgi:uncharacterized protein HemX